MPKTVKPRFHETIGLIEAYSSRNSSAVGPLPGAASYLHHAHGAVVVDREEDAVDVRLPVVGTS